MNPQPNTPASLNEAVADERAAFEADVAKEFQHQSKELLRRRDFPGASGEYVQTWVQTRWEGWRNRAALAALGAAIDAREQEDEDDAASEWRRLALQFDGHRMMAMGLLKFATVVLKGGNKAALKDLSLQVNAFVAAPPLSGEEVLAQRIAALASRQEAPAASAQAAVDAIAAFAPKIEDNVHGRRWRCQQCGHAWMPSEKEHHATNCAYVIATSVPHAAPSRATPSEALSPATVAQPAFYINPKVIDPLTGKLSPHLNAALTWSHTPTPKHWTMPVYLAAQPRAVDGSWLWGKLMDFCKGRGYAPADFNDLFAIVGESRVVPETPSEKQKKLLDLADRIDHEQLCLVAGMNHDKFTPEQKDRMNAGVALRRYAHLWAPGRWVVFPPEGPVHFSASTLDKAYEMAKKDENRKGDHTI